VSKTAKSETATTLDAERCVPLASTLVFPPSPSGPSPEYGVAYQSRKRLPVAPEVSLILAFPGAGRLRSKRRAVAIEYSRSVRIGGNPSAGRNRAHGVGASGCWTPEAGETRSPPLDSRCLAFSGRSARPGECELSELRELRVESLQRVLGLVA